MAQFDVYRNPNPETSTAIPYLLDIQSDLIDVLRTRVVVPLERCDSFQPAERLSPVFTIENKQVAMATPELAGIHQKSLGVFVCSLSSERDAIIAALDLLFSGV